MVKNQVKIADVVFGSIAEEVGIVPGDFLIEIDGHTIWDVFDYRYYIAAENLELKIEKADGEVWEIEIEKEYEDELGLEFENPMISEEKSCTNKCVFCFIDQLPKGMRDTMYFKDDDSRLSFLTGNYVTLTNMKDEELERIVNYRLSPINISVHTTNPKLREEMLGNRFAGNIMSQIKKITDSGLIVNAQIVVCPGINDGQELEHSIRDLSALYPGMNSLSVVPVGLTRFREGLPELRPFDAVKANETLDTVEVFQKKNLKQYGSRIVFAADELFIKANRKTPSFAEYEDFPQIENGVGLIASLRKEFEDECKKLDKKPQGKLDRRILVATGIDAKPLIEELAVLIETKLEGLEIKVIGVENKFFGETVTVCGLLTGQDVLEAVIAAKTKGEQAGILLLCSSMFRAGEGVFLDDMTVEELEEKTGMEILISDNSGKQLVEKMIGR